MDTYDLDEDGSTAADRDQPGRSDRARQWWPAALALAVVLLVVATAVAIGLDQRSRDREFTALLDRVTQAQATVVYSQGAVQAMVSYTSPQLTSARAPERVRAGLRQIVQKAAADRVAPLQSRRDAVADVPVAQRHRDLRRARAAYLAHLDERIAFYRTVGKDLRILYRPRPQAQQLQATARTALLAASPDDSVAGQVRDLLP